MTNFIVRSIVWVVTAVLVLAALYVGGEFLIALGGAMKYIAFHPVELIVALLSVALKYAIFYICLGVLFLCSQWIFLRGRGTGRWIVRQIRPSSANDEGVK